MARATSAWYDAWTANLGASATLSIRLDGNVGVAIDYVRRTAAGGVWGGRDT